MEETARVFTGHSNEACVILAEEMLGRRLPESFLDDFLERELVALGDGLRPIPGVVDAMQHIPYPMCVASSGLPEKIRASLTGTGLLGYFDGRIFSVAEVPNPKPAPDIYLHAARRMGAPPARCAVIEDSPTGAQAGVAAGMTVFGYAGETDGELLAAVGAQVYSEMRELPALLAGATAG